MNLRQKNKNLSNELTKLKTSQRQIIQIKLWPFIDEPSMLQPFLPEHLCCGYIIIQKLEFTLIYFKV